jgi:protein-S-isoprenylcysteine O-methyltransferase Ste14
VRIFHTFTYSSILYFILSHTVVYYISYLQLSAPASFRYPLAGMFRHSFITTLVLAVAVQAVPAALPCSNRSQTETPINTNTGSNHLSTESIISIISVVVTIIIGIVTLFVTIFGIALAWWQWRRMSQGRSRRASSTTKGTHPYNVVDSNRKPTQSIAPRFYILGPSNIRSLVNVIPTDFRLDTHR